jgi:plasmid stability protein
MRLVKKLRVRNFPSMIEKNLKVRSRLSHDSSFNQ